MTMSAEDKAALSEIRMQKAYQFLDDAKSNLAESRLSTAINRSYHAAFGAVRALLILEGIDPESHAGAVTMLSLRFVRPGTIDRKVVRNFKTLQSRRSDADYGDFETVETSDASDSVGVSEAILAEVDTVRKALIAEM